MPRDRQFTLPVMQELFTNHELLALEDARPKIELGSPVRRVGIVGGGTAGWFTALALRAQIPELEVTVIETPSVADHRRRRGERPEPRLVPAPLLEARRPRVHARREAHVEAGHPLRMGPARRVRVPSALRLGGERRGHARLDGRDGQRELAHLAGRAHGARRHARHPHRRQAPVVLAARLVRVPPREPAARRVLDRDGARARRAAARAQDRRRGARRRARRRRSARVAPGRRGRRAPRVRSLRRLLGLPLALARRQARRAVSALHVDALHGPRVLAFNSPHGGRLKAYTTARTMDHGWCWSIPMVESDHCGYVFSSAYCGEAEALDEARRLHPELSRASASCASSRAATSGSGSATSSRSATRTRSSSRSSRPAS